MREMSIFKLTSKIQDFVDEVNDLRVGKLQLLDPQKIHKVQTNEEGKNQ